MNVVDMHSHLPASRSSDLDSWDTADAVARLDRLGVDFSVIFTMDFRAGGDLVRQRASNDMLGRVATASGGRFIPFCTVDPQDTGAADEIHRCVSEFGCRGVKLHPWAQSFGLGDSGMTPVAAAAAALDIPILFHDGTPPSSNALQIAAFAERHPATRVVLGHGGLFDAWADAVAAAQRNPNVSIVLSGTSPLEIFAKVVELAGPAKVAFGTDTRYELDDEYVSRMRLERIRMIIDRYPPDDQVKLARGNALALLGPAAKASE